MMNSLLLLVLGIAPRAQAFCGAYVGTEGAELSNKASRIVLARTGDENTLTMFNDYAGDQSTFGLIIPVPSAIDRDNVHLVSPDLLDRVDEYTAPRLVAYTCEDFFNDDGETISTTTRVVPSQASPSGSVGCTGSGPSGDYSVDTSDNVYDTAHGIEISDEFSLEEYEAWVLQAGEGEGLSGWLAEQGFSLPEGADAVFDEYIAADAHFLALRVELDSLPEGRDWLSPLQIRYRSDSLGLPIRMGALSSAGTQDLIVYTINAEEEGRTAISNYAEAALPEEECLLKLDEPSLFAELYGERWSEAVGIEEDGSSSGLAWTTEYSWGTQGVKCDPCPEGGPLSQEELAELGYYGSRWHVTRMHLRYTPDAVERDLIFYPTRITEPEQVRYIAHAWELESFLPSCDVEPESPGSCYSAEYFERLARGEIGGAPRADDLSGCRASARALLLAPFALALFRRRRVR